MAYKKRPDPTRERILAQLRTGPKTALEIQEAVYGATDNPYLRECRYSTFKSMLSVLRRAGHRIVLDKPTGRYIWHPEELAE